MRLPWPSAHRSTVALFSWCQASFVITIFVTGKARIVLSDIFAFIQTVVLHIDVYWKPSKLHNDCCHIRNSIDFSEVKHALSLEFGIVAVTILVFWKWPYLDKRVELGRILGILPLYLNWISLWTCRNTEVRTCNFLFLSETHKKKITSCFRTWN